MTSKTPHQPTPSSQHHHEPTRRPGPVAALRAANSRRHHWHQLATAVGAVAVVGTVAAMMLSSRTTTSSVARPAPAFTLTTTAGSQVSLADYRGRNVVLYFSEGAGCGPCLQQMGSIEKNAAQFTKAHVTVLPIVMNSRAQITHDMSAYSVKTPFLLDDGTVSKAYHALGRGMHEGLPGHSFVLVDAKGIQRWYGEYPSMWLSPTDLLTQVRKHLTS